jgi:hypothetical protein
LRGIADRNGPRLTSRGIADGDLAALGGPCAGDKPATPARDPAKFPPGENWGSADRRSVADSHRETLGRELDPDLLDLDVEFAAGG